MIMKRFFKWLETKFSRHSAIDKAEELHIPAGVRVTPKENIKEDYSVNVEIGFDPEVSGRIESHGSEKNVLIRNRDASDDTTTQPMLKILSDSSLDANKSAGIDPYDTGCFDMSKTWGSRSHK